MSDLPEKILLYLDRHGTASSPDMAKHFGEDHQRVVGAVKSLECLDELVTASLQTVKRYVRGFQLGTSSRTVLRVNIDIFSPLLKSQRKILSGIKTNDCPK